MTIARIIDIPASSAPSSAQPTTGSEATAKGSDLFTQLLGQSSSRDAVTTADSATTSGIGQTLLRQPGKFDQSTSQSNRTSTSGSDQSSASIDDRASQPVDKADDSDRTRPGAAKPGTQTTNSASTSDSSASSAVTSSAVQGSETKPAGDKKDRSDDQDSSASTDSAASASTTAQGQTPSQPQVTAVPVDPTAQATANSQNGLLGSRFVLRTNNIF